MLIKLPRFQKVTDYVNTPYELAFQVNLWEGGPVGVKLKPLSDPLIGENIEGLVAVTLFGEGVYKLAGELTLGLIWRALDKGKEGVVFDEVIDFTESFELFLFEPFLIELILSLNNGVKLIWGRILVDIRINLVWMYHNQCWYLIHVKLI